MKVVYTQGALRDIEEITTFLRGNYPGAGAAVDRRIKSLDFARVMAGLDPAIHVLSSSAGVRVDARDKRGHDVRQEFCS